MIAIEHVFQLLTPKGLSLEAVHGRGIFSKEDAMGVIAQVQSQFPIGVKVLEARICGNIDAEDALINALTERYKQDFSPIAASALAKLAVNEVCGTRICGRCNGTTLNYHRNGECKHCCGTGRLLNTADQLTRSFCDLSRATISTAQFTQHFYDKYMEGIDTLYQHEHEATRAAKNVLRLIAEEQHTSKQQTAKQHAKVS